MVIMQCPKFTPKIALPLGRYLPASNCPGRSGWAGTRKVKIRKVKTNLDLLEQEIVSGSGICWAICKSAPHPRQPRQHPTTQLPPKQQRESTEGKINYQLMSYKCYRLLCSCLAVLDSDWWWLLLLAEWNWSNHVVLVLLCPSFLSTRLRSLSSSKVLIEFVHHSHYQHQQTEQAYRNTIHNMLHVILAMQMPIQLISKVYFTSSSTHTAATNVVISGEIFHKKCKILHQLI